MKTLVLFLLSLLSFYGLMGQPIPPIQWQKALGGSQNEADADRSPTLRIIKTTDRGYAIAATTWSSNGDVSGNGGKHDAWVVKLNEKGAVQWEKNFGGNDWDWINSIQQTSDGGYIVCGVVSSTNIPFNIRPGAFDVWVMKLSADGQLEWQRFYGGTSYDYGQAIWQTPDGGYIFCGRTESVNGDVSGNHGKSDIWVVRLDSAGGLLWQKCYGGGYTEFGNSIIPTTDGGYMIGGWQSQTGSDVLYNNDMQSYVIKIDADGNQQWEGKYGGSRYEDIKAIKQTSDGGYIFTGEAHSNDGDVSGNHFGAIAGYHDIWVVKLNSAGTLVWQKCIGGSWGEAGHDVVETANGYYVAGTSQSNDGDFSGNHNYTDGVVAMLDFNGQLIATRLYGGTGTDQFQSILIEQTQGNTEFVLGGQSASNDGDVSGGHGGADVWVVKLSELAFQFNTIAGNIYLDNNGNGSQDGGEGLFDNAYVYIRDRSGFYSPYKNTAPGTFNVPVDTGRYETDLNFADTSQYRYFPRKKISVFGSYGNTDYFQIGVIDKSLLSLLQIDMLGLSDARPDRPVTYRARYLYQGTRTNIDGLIRIVKDPALTFISATLNPEFVAGDTLGFRFNGLMPDTEAEFFITFQVPDIPAVQPGDTLRLYYNIMPLTPDSAWFDTWLPMRQEIAPKANFIKGNVYFDANANGVRDGNEIDFTEGGVIAEKGATSVGSDIETGSFTLEVDTGTYTTRLIIPRPYYTVSPSTHVSSFSAYYNTDSFDFAVVPMPGIKDLQLDIVPVERAKPGFGISQYLFVSNYGSEAVDNPSLKYVKDPRTTYIDAMPAPASIDGDTLIWNIRDLAPFDAELILLGLQVAAPPAVNQDDTLRFYGIVSPVAGDTLPVNNEFVLKQVVVNSFDPNDKTESHAGVSELAALENGESLNYLIRFQNTGNDVANNVRITDTLESKLDWTTFEMVAASHPYSIEIRNGNIITWHFENILLPDSTADEPASHGFIAYRIKANNTVLPGDTIRNFASIYFDFNAPLATNTDKLYIQAAALPVNFITVNAALRDQVVDINWKTGYEQNISRFEIQRSVNGQQFETIGFVNATNSPEGSEYQFTDQQPLPGNNYYRIKSVDLDLQTRHSKAVLVSITHPGELLFTLYPNPAKGAVWLKVQAPVTGMVQMGVYDLAGKLIYNKNLGLLNRAGLNTQVTLPGIKAGAYVIKLTVGGKTYVNRLVVQ